MMKIYF